MILFSACRNSSRRVVLWKMKWCRLAVAPALVPWFLLLTPLAAAPRDTRWAAVAEALEKDLPKTAVERLKPLERQAFAEGAVAEGTKAFLMRLRLENGLGFGEDPLPEFTKKAEQGHAERDPFADPFAGAAAREDDSVGGLTGCIRQLERELPSLPASARPVLRWFQAKWLVSYHDSQSYDWHRRTLVKSPPDDSLEHLDDWDPARVLAAARRAWQEALASKEELRKIPVNEWSALFRPGTLGDEMRPTLYDLLVHDYLRYLEFGSGRGEDDVFRIGAASPVFADAEDFIAWQPAAPEGDSPRYQALRIYQELLAFHRADRERSAFLHCDLERLRWAGRVATGRGKAARQREMIRAFIAAHADHPLSADARQDDAILWLQQGKRKAAHDSALAGAEAFPAHPFGRMCRGLVLEIEEPYLELSTTRIWPPAGERIDIRQANLERIWFRLYPCEWRPKWWPDDKANKERGIPETREEFVALLKTKPFRAWEIALDAARDYDFHEAGLETPKDLPPGSYLLVVAGDPAFARLDAATKWTRVEVSGLALVAKQFRHEAGGIEGKVVDPVSGDPLPDVSVECWQARKDVAPQRFEARSNDDGIFDFTLPQAGERSEIFLMASRGGQRAMAEHSLSEPIPLESHDERVSLFTDRALYRPGQEIRFKGICSEVDRDNGRYTTVPGKKIAVSLVGPNDLNCGKSEFTSNALGSFSGSFRAPDRLLLGEYTLKAGDLGSQELHVEEYKRPKFTVELSPPEQAARLGEKVEVKGHARDFTGAAVGDAEVSWIITRYPYFTGRNAWRYGYLSLFNSSEFDHGSTRTAADGSFIIGWLAEAADGLEEAPELAYGFEIEVEVTAPSGETETIGTEVNAGPVELEAEVRVSDWNETGKAVEIEVFTSTLNWQPRAAQGVLRIHRLREPDVCPRDDEPLFWQDESFDAPLAGAAGWDTGELVREVPVNTAISKHGDIGGAEVSVELQAGRYRAIFEGRDSRGKVYEAIADLQVVDPLGERFPTKLPFFTAMPHATCEPGEEFTLLWGSGLASARACVEWRMDGRLLKREWSTPSRTQQVFRFVPDESMRGGISVQATQVGMNRLFHTRESLSVPWSNKDLKIEWERIVSKLEPGARETWTAVIRGPDDRPASAEMVATLYDASLDVIRQHDFETGPWQSMFRRDQEDYWGSSWFDNIDSGNGSSCPGATDDPFSNRWRSDGGGNTIERPYRVPVAILDGEESGRFIGLNTDGRYSGREPLLASRTYDFYEPPELPNSVGSDMGGRGGSFPVTPATPASSWRDSREEAAARKALTALVARQNLRETALFEPHLMTDENGVVRISFTIPEGLGKWRFLGFAHDTAMRFGTLEGEAVTAKNLMVHPNPPRFLREGDTLEFPVRIVNRGAEEQRGLARFTASDDKGAADLTRSVLVGDSEQLFRIPAGESRTLVWRIRAPEGAGPLRYKVLASCGDLSDGEEGWLPVLPRRVPVTDSLAVAIRGPGEKRVSFEGLRDSGKSDTLRHEGLLVQVVSHPEWQALLALPWLMEYPHECAEQTFHRYYAAALGRHLVASDPRIRAVLEAWRGIPALDSTLERNQEIAGILLEETPWLRDAGNESQARRRIARMMRDDSLAAQAAALQDRLEKMQRDDGLWPWFAGGEGSETTTLTIVTGFARLRSMGVEVNMQPVQRALGALDELLEERLAGIEAAAKKDPSIRDGNHLTPWIARQLYVRALFSKEHEPEKAASQARDFFLAQAKRYWPKLDSRMARAHVAIALNHSGDEATAKLITRSLREHALRNEEQGMFWRDAFDDGWWWWQAPLETQAMMIEAFWEIDRDEQAVDDCRTWLIQQKRAEAWPTTTGTADAVRAILAGPGAKAGGDPLDGPPMEVSLGGVALRPDQVEAGSGGYEHRFEAAEVKTALAEIVVTKPDTGIAWTSVHWQYLEDLSKLKDHQTKELQLEKSMWVVPRAGGGDALEPAKGPLRVGDEVVTRLILRNERPMEFVHLKDGRGSGLEPARALSGHRWQDGVALYEETRDSATHLFLEYMPAGTHVFETRARVQHAGVYQGGMAEARCMYAPEFHARAAGGSIEAASVVE